MVHPVTSLFVIVRWKTVQKVENRGRKQEELSAGRCVAGTFVLMKADAMRNHSWGPPTRRSRNFSMRAHSEGLPVAGRV
ncbi:protein of unknown function [Nitrospira japonica]|uniref:Uncharacterized protein n=1 Tax=Nitrospira japonica TaxID=1325564 RepID=A0A1W1I316_9BACT|nr:protein of unknown function [Nitrospira japonica]